MRSRPFEALRVVAKQRFGSYATCAGRHAENAAVSLHGSLTNLWHVRPHLTYEGRGGQLRLLQYEIPQPFEVLVAVGYGMTASVIRMHLPRCVEVS